MAMQRYEEMLPDRAQAAAGFQSIKEFQDACRQYLVRGKDYGAPFPGSDKESLLKPGAEKICRLAGVEDRYEVLESITDYDKGLRMATVRCTLIHLATGQAVTTGLGECSSYESRYRWRWAYDREVEERGLDINSLVSRIRTGRSGQPYTQYRIENEDIVDQFNTVLKMAQKRALVGAALGVARMSDIFTQDGDDYAANATAPPSNDARQQAPQGPAQQSNAGTCEDCNRPTRQSPDGTYYRKCFDCNQRARSGGQQQRPAQNQPQRAPEPPPQPEYDEPPPEPVQGAVRASVWDLLRDEVESDQFVPWGEEFSNIVLKMPMNEFVVLNGNDMGTAAVAAKRRYDMYKESREGGLGWIDEPNPN